MNAQTGAGREIEPTPADDLEVGEVGLPELVWRGGLVGELLGYIGTAFHAHRSIGGHL